MGGTLFQMVLDYQLPLFPSHEYEIMVPSAAALVRRCHLVWRRARQSHPWANKKWSTAPDYQVSQKVWLSTADLPLRTKCRKLAPHFFGPFPVAKVMKAVVVRLQLPRPLHIHPHSMFPRLNRPFAVVT